MWTSKHGELADAPLVHIYMDNNSIVGCQTPLLSTSCSVSQRAAIYLEYNYAKFTRSYILNVIWLCISSQVVN